MQTFKHPLSKEAETDYLKKCKAGDLEARNLLIEYNLRLVAHIVKKYNNFERDLDDLLSVGTIGLIKAIDTYDIHKGNRLVTYASRCIENEILMMLRHERKHSKEFSLYEPIGTDKEGNEISMLDIVECETKETLDQIILQDDLLQLNKLLDSTLEPREIEVLSLRYGLQHNTSLTQKEIATKLAISRSYVSRIEKKALQKLQKSFNTLAP